MTTWYVRRRDDGTIASAHGEPQEGYAEEAVDDSDPALEALLSPPDASLRRVHPYYFRLRFTQPQRIAIATSVDPSVIDLREGFAAADTIGLDDPRTALGLQLLAIKGLIDQGDVTKLLADRKPQEKP